MPLPDRLRMGSEQGFRMQDAGVRCSGGEGPVLNLTIGDRSFWSGSFSVLPGGEKTDFGFKQSSFDHLPEDPRIAGILFYNSSMTSCHDYNITGDPMLKEEFCSGVGRIHAAGEQKI